MYAVNIWFKFLKLAAARLKKTWIYDLFEIKSNSYTNQNLIFNI